MTIQIAAVAYREAPIRLFENGNRLFAENFPDVPFESNSKEPDVIFFLSGGSEREAISLLDPGRLTILLADFPENAFAAAMEVKAWADQKNVPSVLVSMKEAKANGLPGRLNRVSEAFKKLSGKRAGLIGNVSHWLVASEFPLGLAMQKFGIGIEHLPWGSLPDYSSFSPDPGFLEAYKDHHPEKLPAEAGIHAFLQHIIRLHGLDAITLECFEMVNNDHVTACLSLALINSEGIVAGCEGDLVSLAGLMLVQALTGSIPWMANVASVDDATVLFAHCTAPLSLIDSFRVNTHFETGKSAAIEGSIGMKEVTVFRLGNDLRNAFVAVGTITHKPRHGFACRTQTEIILEASDIKRLRQQPLGNHHLIIPGDQQELIRLACRYKGISVD